MTQCWNLGAISINERQMAVEQVKPVQVLPQNITLSNEQKGPEKEGDERQQAEINGQIVWVRPI